MDSERQIGRIVRDAARASYGVAAVAGVAWYERLAGRLGLDVGGVEVRQLGLLVVRVNVRLAPGVPARQVAANVADAVRYAVQRDAGRTIDSLTVTVDGLPVAGSDSGGSLSAGGP